MRRVAVFQHRLLHYRAEFFEQLRSRLSLRGIELILVHGQPSPREKLKRDTCTLGWATEVENRIWEMGGVDVVWQPVPEIARTADLVILMQENRLISNYRWFISREPQQKIAFWGHGKNFQSRQPSGLKERWKRAVSVRVDWWFAYTEISAQILQTYGYPADRITVLNNAIDTRGFLADLASVNVSELGEIRRNLGVKASDRVGLFCGSLYADKKIPYLISACDMVHASEPNFHLIVVGDGPEVDVIKDAASTRPWLHWVGAKRGRDKAKFFRMSDLILNPGAVGLHVLDSFCAGSPMVTTKDALHGPEIAYMKNYENGIVVDGGSEAYAEMVLRLLGDRELMASLRVGAQQASTNYTLDRMVERFADGVERCLDVRPIGCRGSARG